MGEEVRTLPSPLGLSDFDLGVTLGTGSFGRVRFVTHKVSLETWKALDKLCIDVSSGGLISPIRIYLDNNSYKVGSNKQKSATVRQNAAVTLQLRLRCTSFLACLV